MHLAQYIFRFVSKRVVFAFLLFLSLFTAAQNKRGNIWYFGNKAGLDFNSGTFPPTPLTDGQMNTLEGCASIADKNGQLLFYTDGTRIWDRTHTPMPNANGSLADFRTIAIQPDGKIIIGGNFTTFDGVNRNNIARLNADGTPDMTFNPGTGTNNTVSAVTLQPDGKIIIGGSFTDYNGTGRNRITRIDTNGTLDTTFNPGIGTNGTVNILALQLDGKIIIGGNFSDYNGTGRNRITRIDTNGTLDTTFNPGIGTNGTINTLVLQSDGKIIIGGFFTNYNGIGRNYIARIDTNGMLDTTFNPGTGANDFVRTLALQPDGKIIIGGSFTDYNGIGRNHIARLDTNGTLDTTFNPGTGTNNTVSVIALQPDGKVIISGNFTDYNGTERNYIARLDTDATLDMIFSPSIGISAAAVVQSDGKIILGGNSWPSLVLLNPNGSVDETAFKDYWHFMLSGDNSSTQSSIITPVMGSTQRYYVFTTDGSSHSWLGDGLYYTVVDMTLNGGLGDIDTAFIRNLGYPGNKFPLADNIGEKITAAVHTNGWDYWIITQKYFTGDFYAFKINCSGIDTTPVITYADSFGLGDTIGYGGYLTASLDGKSLAAAYTDTGINFWLCDFNNSTGEVTNIRTVNTGDWNKYGVCFSPNDSIVYVTGSGWFGNTHRYNRFTLEEGDIINSSFSALALGPDNRIYMAGSGSSLSVLHSPNNFDDPGFKANAVPLAPGISRSGLPNFFNLYATGNSFGNKQFYEMCPEDSIKIGYSFDNTFDIQWTPEAGLDSIDIANPVAFPDTTTTYFVRLITPCDTIYDTITVQVQSRPDVDLGTDTAICQGQSLLLYAGEQNTYVWSTGDSTDSVYIEEEGLYYVVAIDSNHCSSSDSINIQLLSLPDIYPGYDTTICNGKILELTAGEDIAVIYIWSTGDTARQIMVSQEGKYYVQATNANDCISNDSIIINIENCAISLPDIFSPNRDGLNDDFYILGNIQKIYSITDFKIFNRWGEVVFETQDKQTGWDGTYKNVSVPAGMYVYYLDIFLMDGTEEVLQGKVVLVR